MFGSSPKKAKKRLESFDSLIGQTSKVIGRLSVHKSIRVDGEVTGNVEKHDASHDVSIALGETGKIHGDIIATDIFIAGVVTGNIYAQGKVELTATSHVYGDIHYHLIEIEEGAQIDGTLIQSKNNPPVIRPSFKLE